MARPLVAVRDRLLRELDACRDLLHRSAEVRSAVDNRQGFSRAQLRWIHELSLIKATTAWELYLELSLAHYVLGHRAPGGRLFARKKQLRGVSLAATRKTFAGDGEFVSWIEFKVVTDRADKWLRGGEPFRTVLGSVGAPLHYVRFLRNAIAHSSASAWELFESKTRTYYGALPRDATPGSQLMAAPAASFGLGPGTLLEGLIDLFEALTKRITP